MTIDVTKLSVKERQQLLDDLVRGGQRPTELEGTGSPAHVEMLRLVGNDLRQMLSLQTANLAKTFGLLGVQPRTAPDGTVRPEQLRKGNNEDIGGPKVD